jgi:hypothetical protein
MSAMEQGARAVEQAVREGAEARDVAITRLSWNGDEGLKARQSLQTLLVSSTQSGSRASFTREQLDSAAEAQALPTAMRIVIDRLIEDLHASAASGTTPRGGSG